MTTNTAPSNNTAVQNTTASPVRTIHEHTLMSAVECFDNAVDKNIAKFKEPISAAVRRALPWGEGTLLKQIKDPEQAKAFTEFLARERAEHLKPVREERPKGPTLLTADDVKARLEASDRPFVLAADLYRNVRRWDPTETQKIEDVVIAVLGTAKRQEYVRKGVVLSAETIAQSAEEVKKFVAGAKRSTQPRKSQGNQRPRGHSGGHHGSSGFSNHQTVERKYDGPKVTDTRSDLEKKAAELKWFIANAEASLKTAVENGTFGSDPLLKDEAIASIKAKKQELADVRTKIAAENEARAEANKKERIARAAASSKASLTIPATYKVKEKQAAPAEPTKGKKKR